MGKQVGVWFLAALLLVALNCVLAEDKYFAVNGTLELRPEKQTAAISSILWKHNGNLVAESLGGVLTYYGAFQGRTTLDTTTGRLEINNLREADSGEYSVEINNVVQSTNYQVKVINKVLKPVVWVQPVACDVDSKTCTLTCNGDTAGAEPVTYSWKEGAEDWKESGKTVNINDTMTDVKTFNCKMKNPVSEQESEPEKNPFYKAAPEVSLNGGAVFGIVVGVVLAVLAVPAVIYRKPIIQNLRNRFNREPVPTEPPSGPNGEAAPPGPNGEAAPLDKSASGTQVNSD